jgi:hypothetical protein
VLEATLPRKRYVRWIDPARGGNLIKAQRDVEELPATQPSTGRSNAPPVVHHTFVVEIGSLAKIGECFVPMEASWKSISKLADGSERGFAVQHRRTALDFNPTFGPNDFTIKAADGSEVWSLDRPAGVPWIWKDGKITSASGVVPLPEQ